MFSLSQTVRGIIGNTFFDRGREYYQKKRVVIRTAEPTEHGVEFSGIVRGSEKYETNISVEFLDNTPRITCSCVCPAFHEYSGRCKHISAFALAVEEVYEIDEKEKVVRRKGEFHSPVDGITNDEEDWDDLSLIDPIDFMTALEKIAQAHPEIPVENIIQNIVRSGSEGIVSRVTNEQELSKNHSSQRVPAILTLLTPPVDRETEEKYYRIKIDFATARRTRDIYLALYECKLLKNGSLSSWREISQSGGRSLPWRYKRLIPFLQESGSYYNASFSRLSFRTAPDFFIRILLDAEEVCDASSNRPIRIDSTTFRLRVDTDQKDGKWRMYGTLVSDSFQPIFTRWLSLIPSEGKEGWYGTIFVQEDMLVYFRSSLPSAFVRALFERDIFLSEKDRKALVVSAQFDTLAPTLHSIESFGITPVSIRPTLLFRLSVPEEFDRVECEWFFDYDGTLIASHDARPYIRLPDGRWIVRERDTEDEETHKPELQAFIASFDDIRGTILIKHANDSLDDFFDGIDRMIASAHVRFEYLQSVKRFTTKSVSMKVSVKTAIDWLDMSVEISVGDEVLADGESILEGIRNNKKYIVLENGTAVILRDTLGNAVRDLEDIGIDASQKHPQRIGRHMIGALQSSTKNSSLSFSLDRQAKNLKKTFENFSGIPDMPIPQGLHATLRDYQTIGYQWLGFLYANGFSGILADDMGLGKTIQTIAFLLRLYEDITITKPSLVVCPTSLVFNWIDEFHKFAPSMRVVSITSSKTDWDTLTEGTQIIVISYTVLSLLTDTLLDRDFQVIILDEAQNIKNSQAKRAKNLSLLRSHARIALSGTPIENHLGELWSIFRFLMPWFLGSEKSFRDRYTGAEKDVLVRLSAKVRPFILRRTKEQVAKELPPKVEETIYLDMGEEQMKFYQALKVTYRDRIKERVEEDGFKKSQFFIFEALMRLRQACLIPRLVSDTVNTPDNSIKLTYLEENIEDIIASGHSVLIFSQFPSFLAFVRTLLDNKHIPYQYLDGTTKNRKELVESFNAGKAKIFLISLNAGGTGLNLVSADYVIHLDPWWNPAVENQATDRAHRIGQTRTVFVQKLIVRGTIEEKVLELQNTKKRLVEDIFSGDWTGKLDEGDIRWLFE